MRRKLPSETRPYPGHGLGGVSCETHVVRELSERIRALKAEYGLKPAFGAKWTKVSPARVDFYLELVDLFVTDDRLRFRGLVVPDKGLLNHAAFDQTHDDWYYKMYFGDNRIGFGILFLAG